MSKKTNTLIFILCATVFNVIIIVLCFFAYIAIYSKFFYPILPESSAAWIFPAGFIIAIAASFLIYRQLVKVITKKFDMEKHFDPIFKKRK